MDVSEKILSKASEMFLLYGVRNVTMDALSGELGISKRTLYEKFRDKDTLVIECLRYMLLQDNSEMLRIIERSDNVMHAIVNIMKHSEEKRKQFPVVFLEDIKKYYKAVNANFYGCKETLKEYSASYILIVRGIEQGMFRKELNTELVDTFLHELISMLHNSERFHLLAPSDDEVFLNIILPYFRGLSTPKGLALLESYVENQLNRDTNE